MESGHIWYFAFGANMNSSVLSARRVAPLSREPAKLADFRLTFKERGVPIVEPGFATIERAPGECVHGLLLRLEQSAFSRIDSTESPGYALLEVDVVGRDSGSVRAIAFTSRHPVEGLIPSKRYLDLICEGAREHGLPASYVRALERHPARDIPGVRMLTALGASAFRELQRRAFAVLDRVRRRSR